MLFYDVLELLMWVSTARFRRPHWPEGFYINKRYKENRIRINDGEYWLPTQEDLFTEDWVSVEKKD